MRARIPLPFVAWIKRFMPRSLLGRTLLIMLVPLVLVQAIALQTVLRQPPGRRVAPAVQRDCRRDLHTRFELMRQFHTPADREWVLDMARQQFTLAITLEPGAVLAAAEAAEYPGADG